MEVPCRSLHQQNKEIDKMKTAWKLHVNDMETPS